MCAIVIKIVTSMFRTEKQRKKLCSSCPIAKAADIIGNPCTLIVVRELLGGPKRFSDLESSLKGISSRTLASKLKKLVENGIVGHGKIGAHLAVRGAAYSLTPKGIGLRGITVAMKKYGEHYL
jgi:DNA-binding HxlR family transcriptional regulator